MGCNRLLVHSGHLWFYRLIHSGSTRLHIVFLCFFYHFPPVFHIWFATFNSLRQKIKTRLKEVKLINHELAKTYDSWIRVWWWLTSWIHITIIQQWVANSWLEEVPSWNTVIAPLAALASLNGCFSFVPVWWSMSTPMDIPTWLNTLLLVGWLIVDCACLSLQQFWRWLFGVLAIILNHNKPSPPVSFIIIKHHQPSPCITNHYWASLSISYY